MGSIDLGMGVTTDIFAAFGNVPVFRERLNKLVTVGVIVTAVALSMRAEIPSGPLAFVTSRPEGLKE